MDQTHDLLIIEIVSIFYHKANPWWSFFYEKILNDQIFSQKKMKRD